MRMKEKLYCIFLFLAVLLSLAAYCITIAWASKSGKSYIGMPSWDNNGIRVLIKSCLYHIFISITISVRLASSAHDLRVPFLSR